MKNYLCEACRLSRINHNIEVYNRPRRFGKSLTLNILQHYYDLRTHDQFDALFGNLYIGQHPTLSRNTYLVLYLNFSGISGELNDYRKGLDAHCGTTIESFCKKYADLLPSETWGELHTKHGAPSRPISTK